MGSYQGPEYYDGVFSRRSKTRYAPAGQPWEPGYRFEAMLEHVPLDRPVVDIGCGPGIFAAVLWHGGHREAYIGVDFSPVGLRLAREGNAQGGHKNVEWIHRDLLEPGLFDYFPEMQFTVVMGELLEHLPGRKDIELLASVPAGSQVVISVPPSNDPSHVRRFFTRDQVVDRYAELLEDWTCFPLHRKGKLRYHLLVGTRR